jgi:CBS domain-containing protein
MSSFDSIPVSHVMRSPVKTIQENEIMQQACKVMIQYNIGSIIVVAAHSVNAQAPAGIITERDIVRHMAEKPISLLKYGHTSERVFRATVSPLDSIAFPSYIKGNVRKKPYSINRH